MLGGTFNPIHIAHLILGEEALALMKLDEVVYVPAQYPWRKGHVALASGEHRLAMTRLATQANPCFDVSPVDIDRGGATYTVDTIHDLQQHYGADTDFYFLMGMDSLLDLPHWHRPAELAEMVQFVVFRRPNFEPDWNHLERSMPVLKGRVTLLPTPLMGISSTEIRRRITNGLPIRYWTPDAVADYIEQCGLYRVPDDIAGENGEHGSH